MKGVPTVSAECLGTVPAFIKFYYVTVIALNRAKTLEKNAICYFIFSVTDYCSVYDYNHTL